MWPDTRLIELIETEHPIILAPMVGVMDTELAIAASVAGALGSLPCAMISADKIREQVSIFRQRVSAPLNLNFFAHEPKPLAPDAEAQWKRRLGRYYAEHGIDPDAPINAANRAPFDEAMCKVVEETRPEVVSFHFGLPEQSLMARVKAAGCKVLGSATVVREAVWLEAHGADAVIAQGAEAGGHRGMFLTDDIATQIGLFALLPQIADAVTVPVIAAGGIMGGVQIGSAYLRTPEATGSAPAKAALGTARDDSTAITNVMTGRPARGVINRVMREVGPVSADAPVFPHAATALAPLKVAAEKQGKADFTNLWAGQGIAMGGITPAAELTRQLAQNAQARLPSP